MPAYLRKLSTADLVVMLASDRCANMMGAGMTIDGGMVPTLRCTLRGTRASIAATAVDAREQISLTCR